MAKLIAFFLLICSWICKTSGSARKNAWNYTTITKKYNFQFDTPFILAAIGPQRWKWGGMTPAHPNQPSTTNPTFQFLIGRMTSANRSESYKMTDIHPCIHPMTSDNRSTLRATKGFMFRINLFNYHTMKMVLAFDKYFICMNSAICTFIFFRWCWMHWEWKML